MENADLSYLLRITVAFNSICVMLKVKYHMSEDALKIVMNLCYDAANRLHNDKFYFPVLAQNTLSCLHDVISDEDVWEITDELILAARSDKPMTAWKTSDFLEGE